MPSSLSRLCSQYRRGTTIEFGYKDWTSPHISSHRYASTQSRPFFKRIANFKQKNQERAALRPDDLPPLALLSDPAGTIFGRSKATNELKLRCTEFDENGNVILVNGEFKKTELIAKVWCHSV
jgi:hypothetical protein